MKIFEIFCKMFAILIWLGRMLPSPTILSHLSQSEIFSTWTFPISECFRIILTWTELFPPRYCISYINHDHGIRDPPLISVLHSLIFDSFEITNISFQTGQDWAGICYVLTGKIATIFIQWQTSGENFKLRKFSSMTVLGTCY